MTSPSHWLTLARRFIIKPDGRGGRVEGLLQAHEGNTFALKELHKLLQVDDSRGEPIELVDDDCLDSAALDQGQEALQTGALEVLGTLALIPNELQEPPILDRSIRLDLRLLGGDAHAVP